MSLPPLPPPLPNTVSPYTVLDCLKSSLRMIRQLAPGRGPSGSEVKDALLILNQMLETWSTERLAVFTTRIDTFAVIAGKQVYTIGYGVNVLDDLLQGDIAAPRPLQVLAASLDGTPLRVLNFGQWQPIPQKAASGPPEALYCDAAYPLASLYLWPVPIASGNAEITSTSQLAGAIGLTEVDYVAFPPGYAEAIRYNLAIRLGLEWGKEIRPEVHQLAIDSLAKIKALNAPTPELACDDALLYRFRRF